MIRSVIDSIIALTICLNTLAISPSHAETGKAVAAQPAENIALGKKVIYSLAPDFHKDDPAASKLTDGITCQTIDEKDKIVCWHGEAEQLSSTQGIYIGIDLGQARKLDSLSIRLHTASPRSFRFKLPQMITAVVSRDGRDFFKVKSYAKIMTYGPNIPPGAEPFHIRERSCKPAEIRFDANGVQARYIGFHVVAEGFMFFADECLATPWNGVSTGADARIYQPENRYPFFIGHGLSQKDRIFFGPAHDYFAVSRNVTAANLLVFADYRAEGENACEIMRPASWPKYWNDLEFVIELPQGVELIPTRRTKANSITQSHFQRDGKERARFTFKLSPGDNVPGYVARNHHFGRLLSRHRFGPLFFTTGKEFNGRDDAVFYCIADNQTHHKRTVPFYSVDIPPAKPFKDIHVSLCWMFEPYSMDWPDFLDSYKHMGFNAVSTWPGHWIDDDGRLPAELTGFLAAARNAGLDITMNVSPLHGITGGDSPCIDVEPVQLCPTYTGELYQKEIARIRKLYKATSNSDWVFFDSEVFWQPLIDRVQKCPRCRQAREISGLGPKEYLLRCGTRAARDITNAVDRQQNNTRTGFYHVKASTESFQDFLSFRRISPECADIGMPQYYAAGILDYLHSQASAEFKASGKPWQFVTWMSPGTFGEFPSFKLEPMVYEQILNGGGIAFFAYTDFDTPMDLYYFSKAMATLSPYHELISRGAPIQYKGDNPEMYYTAFVAGDQCLLLIGNFTSGQDETARCEIPIEGSATIRELTDGNRIFPAIENTINVVVTPQGFRLFHIETGADDNRESLPLPLLRSAASRNLAAVDAVSAGR